MCISLTSFIVIPLIAIMPRPSINLTPFQDEIERRIAAGESQNQVREWLATEGISIGRNTISKRIVDWKIGHLSTTSAFNPTLISAVEEAFHTTGDDDQTIAQDINTQGIATTSNQVKSIRLAHNWQRRGYDKMQRAQQKAQTFALIDETLQSGECRCYGRELMKTYLHIKFGHKQEKMMYAMDF